MWQKQYFSIKNLVYQEVFYINGENFDILSMTAMNFCNKINHRWLSFLNSSIHLNFSADCGEGSFINEHTFLRVSSNCQIDCQIDLHQWFPTEEVPGVPPIIDITTFLRMCSCKRVPGVPPIVRIHLPFYLLSKRGISPNIFITK